MNTSTQQDLASHFKAVFDEIQDAILLANANGEYIDTNQAAIDLLGYTKEELLNLSVGSLVIPREEGENTADLWRDFLRTGYQEGEITLRRKDNARIVCSYRAKANVLPGLHLSVLTDLSERKRLEKKLSESESRFRTAFEYSALGMAIVDVNGHYVDVNESLCKILGYTKEELTRMTFRHLTYWEDNAQDAKLMAQLVNGSLDQLHRHKRYVHKSGSIILASLRTSAIRDANGNLMYLIVQVEDETEKDKLEKIVSNERQRFALMFTEAPVSMAILKGPTHIFDKANQLYLKLSGRPNVVGRTVREVFPEAEGQGIFEIMDRVYKSGKTYSATELLVRLDVIGDGTLKDIFLDFMFQPYRNKDGQVEGIFFFAVDITEQVIARKRIEESEARYRQIVEVAHEGIWLLDESNVTVFVNQKMAEIIGTSVSDILGRDLWSFVHQDMKPAAEQLMKRHRSVMSNNTELRFISNSKKEIWANLNTNSIFDEFGSYKGCLAMVTDVTERKRVEDELVRLSLIARTTVNAVYITNAKREIEWVNESFTRITGFTFDEVAGKTDLILYGELTDNVTKSMIKKAVRNAAPFECEVVKYSKAGKPFWVQAQGQPILTEAGKLSHYFVLETDITEHKTAYQKLQDTEKEIRSFASQLNESLESERRRIAREIHDELGQQLTGLRMLLSSLGAPGTSRENARKIISDMQQSLDGARSSIRNLATELRPGILDTLGLVPSIDWLAKGFEKKSGIPCSVITRVSARTFDENVATTFFRICQEAFTNIIKHSNATSVTLRITEKGNDLMLKISDNGTGISDEKLQNPFSMGLIGMRERAKIINAKFRIERNDPGTTLQLIYKIA
jgi:PAS domain S-box-containing protein